MILVLTNADTEILALRSVVEGLPPGFPPVRAANPSALGDAVPDLDKASRRKAKEYLEDFYRTLEHPGSVKSQLVDRCAKSGM